MGTQTPGEHTQQTSTPSHRFTRGDDLIVRSDRKVGGLAHHHHEKGYSSVVSAAGLGATPSLYDMSPDDITLLTGTWKGTTNEADAWLIAGAQSPSLSLD